MQPSVWSPSDVDCSLLEPSGLCFFGLTSDVDRSLLEPSGLWGGGEVLWLGEGNIRVLER